MRPRPPRVQFRLNYSDSGPDCQHAILGRARVSTTWLASHPLIWPRTSSAEPPGGNTLGFFPIRCVCLLTRLPTGDIV